MVGALCVVEHPTKYQNSALARQRQVRSDVYLMSIFVFTNVVLEESAETIDAEMKKQINSTPIEEGV
jgi:hypothetical protein